jgi:hypothetical protein
LTDKTNFNDLIGKNWTQVPIFTRKKPIPL